MTALLREFIAYAKGNRVMLTAEWMNERN